MSLTFKTPAEVRDEYLTNLKALRPEINKDQTDSDWYIRGAVTGGVVSGLYADQLKIADDAFPQKARDEALKRHLFVYFNENDFRPAQQASGNIYFTGAPGSTLTSGTTLVYSPNGNSYNVVADVDLGLAATGIAEVTSVNDGQEQNLLEGTVLTISTPPPGIDSSATALFPGIANGRNKETPEEASARILAFIQSPSSGGKASDYQQWAIAASPSVTSASIFRYLFGLGTVGIYITAGTSDIDAAINAGSAIVRTPSPELIDTVQAYIDALKPLTDCAHVLAPNEVGQDVRVRLVYAAGFTGATIITGQTLSLDDLVKREVARALYKIPVGGRKVGNNGYVLASEIEEVIDLALSSTPYTIGSLAEVIIDREVLPLTASGSNRLLKYDEMVKPDVVTITEGVTS